MVEPTTAPPPKFEPSKAPIIIESSPKEIAPPVITPPPQIPTVVAPPPQVEAPENRLKSFVPIRSTGSKPPIAPVIESPSLPPKIGPLPVAPPSAGAIGGMQTPNITIEKRGAPILRSGDGQIYQIAVRNLGPGAAAQVRIEEELPANVRMIYADPIPAIDGQRAAWTLMNVAAGAEQLLRFQLQTPSDIELPNRVIMHVATGAAPATTTTTVQRPGSHVAPIAVQVVPVGALMVGKPAVFEIRVTNQSAQPLSGVTLLGKLPDGVHHPAAQEISGEVEAIIPPGEVKTLRMPTTAVKAGRWNIAVTVNAPGGVEASTNAEINIAPADSLQVQQPAMTRMFVGRSGDMRIDVSNPTDKPLKNVAVVNRLPEGLEYVTSSERGLYQANSRAVHWLVSLPPGASKTLVVRVQGAKSGQHQNVVQARADGGPEQSSVSVIHLEGTAELALRLAGRDALIEVGKETVYEIRIANPGSSAATNVRLHVQFPPGIRPKNADGDTRCTIAGNTVTAEPIPSLRADGQAVYRVSAQAQPTANRDQRVRAAVVSDQVPTPVQREVSTMVVPR
jgi:hypothetical protein